MCPRCLRIAAQSGDNRLTVGPSHPGKSGTAARNPRLQRDLDTPRENIVSGIIPLFFNSDVVQSCAHCSNLGRLNRVRHRAISVTSLTSDRVPQSLTGIHHRGIHGEFHRQRGSSSQCAIVHQLECFHRTQILGFLSSPVVDTARPRFCMCGHNLWTARIRRCRVVDRHAVRHTLHAGELGSHSGSAILSGKLRRSPRVAVKGEHIVQRYSRV